MLREVVNAQAFLHHERAKNGPFCPLLAQSDLCLTDTHVFFFRQPPAECSGMFACLPCILGTGNRHNERSFGQKLR